LAEARDGKMAQSFDRLDKLNVIEQCTAADQHERIAARYLQLTSENQSCVVVSQSHPCRPPDRTSFGPAVAPSPPPPPK
jgi:hypothetical protein